jgi:hypothetical protein
MTLRTALICHHDAPIHSDGMARWMASWSSLTGIVVIEEPPGVMRRRIRREIRRVGALRFLDVMAMRAFYRARLASADQQWLDARLADLREQYEPVPATTRTVRVGSPNSKEGEELLRQAAPDIVIALCKNILAERIFTIPTRGTYVLHPGICPEYRNAHGCFWALAHDDMEKVGMSLVRIDEGIDTGPIFGYFDARFDEVKESHIVIQHRTVLDNLDAIRDRLLAIAAGTAKPVPVNGRPSHEWGQPWLTAYRRWKRHARRRAHARDHA